MTDKPNLGWTQDQRDIEAREALKPCPFCGGAAMAAEVEQIEHCGWVGRIECGNCDAVLSTAYSASYPGKAGDDVKDAWNRRVEIARPAPEALPVAWMDDGSLRAGSEATAHRVITNVTKQGMHASTAASFTVPLYLGVAPEALGTAGVGLSDVEIDAVWENACWDARGTNSTREAVRAFARAILAKSKGEQS